MKERYDNLDGLRVISCLCIIAMHIMANADYSLGRVGSRIIGSWTHFVPLFLMISGFGMFCGYYERFKNGSVDLRNFYSKRYDKILPFFVTLIVIDIVLDRSLSHVIQGLTEATLVFGLLPNNQPEVISVCWTLGLIFLFYMLFPFAVYLCWNRRKAWISLGISIMVSLFCSFYYFTDQFVIEGFEDRQSFLYCAPFFLAGGVVYLNRDAIKGFISRRRWLCLAGCAGLSAAWYFVPAGNSGIWMLKNLILFSAWLMYAISVNSRVLSNKVMKYLSGISLELYLAQMVMFRFVEKFRVLYLFGHGWVSFIAVWAAIVIGLIVFVELWKRLWNFARSRLKGESRA